MSTAKQKEDAFICLSKRKRRKKYYIKTQVVFNFPTGGLVVQTGGLIVQTGGLVVQTGGFVVRTGGLVVWVGALISVNHSSLSDSAPLMWTTA